MKPRTKRIRLTKKVATVYFPSDAGMDDGYRKKWLRARGFSATVDDMSYCVRPVGDCSRMWTPAAHCRTVEVTKVEESFAGASSLPADASLTASDIVALYELLLAQFKPYHRAGYPTPELKLKTVRRGIAMTSRWCPWFSVPAWALSRCEEYAIYYTAHELAHHANGGISHGLEMCLVEAALLAPFDIRIEYRGGVGKNEPWYPKALYRISTGEKICGARGKKI